MSIEEVNEDDWYFDSIMRYKFLNMFELEKHSNLLALTNDRSICLTSNCEGSGSEILEFHLPSSNQGKGRDLKLNCGKLFNNRIRQIGAHYGKGRIIVSEENIAGISVYNLPDQSGSIESIRNVISSIVSPRFAVESADTPHVFIVKNTRQNGFLIDIDANSVLQEVPFSSCNKDCLNSELISVYMERDVVTVCCIETGSIILQDLRTNKSSLHMSNGISDGNSWTFDSKYNASAKIGENYKQSSYQMVMLSSKGCLLNCDLRNWKEPLSKCNVSLETTNPNNLHLNFNPNIDGVFSFAGFDNNVYVYRTVSDGFEPLFTHDGHSHVENCDKNSVVLSHAWTNSNGVASCAGNMTFHLWEYSKSNT
ncbi:WD repeat-containing protein 73 [Nilaparvata lugens]|uniref:WD repeat-containing protein 73 n=1 Tax=Nilaparvata lugens TaxID=108931 RepID=UPI000B98C8B0|nr:WD repeat-containing protein 73 [Nilaparvata lugens]